MSVDQVQIEVECAHQLTAEIRTEPGAAGVSLHAESITEDLGDLIDEAWTSGILGGELPEAAEVVRVAIRPVFGVEPFVASLDVRVEVEAGGQQFARQQSFVGGRWQRRAVATVAQLRLQGKLADDARAWVALCAMPGSAADIPLPALQPPLIRATSLEAFGVVELGAGELDPQRPVLVNERMVEEILTCAYEAGPHETGGGTLGATLRLPQPLPGTATPVVTLLSASLTDARHQGDVGSFRFDTEALAAAAQIADMRGRGERVVTAFHTHGWGRGCDNCNDNESCALPTCGDVSVQDYQVLESLFPSKATLMPIAGRKLGAPGRRPVLEIHAWRDGQMVSLPWRSYRD